MRALDLLFPLALAAGLASGVVGCGEDDRAARRAKADAKEATEAAKDYVEERTPEAREAFRVRMDALRARMEELRARARLRMAEGDADAKLKIEGVVRDLELRYAALRELEVESKVKNVGLSLERAAKELEAALDRAFD